MQYIYPSAMLPGFWYDVIAMVDENYNRDENHNDLFLLGCYMHQTVDQIKKEIYSQHQYSKTIAYQLEPLVENHWWKVDKILNQLQGADEVWDYDEENIEVLRSYGIEAKFRPFKFTHGLKRVPEIDKKTIDVLFYGTFTDHRFRMLHDMIYYKKPTVDELNKMKVVWIYNIDSSDLDEYISKSKIILNLNPYEGNTRQQQSRIFYPLINNKCVVSERSSKNYFGDNIYEFSNQDELKEKLTYLLQNERWKDTSHITYGKI